MSLIATLSNYFSIGSGVITLVQLASENNTPLDEKLLKELTAEIDYDHVGRDLQVYAEAADDFIQKHQNQTIATQLVSDEERIEFCDSFYLSHPDMRMYRYYINPILNAYLDKLEKRLQGALSIGEKFLSSKIDSDAAKVRGDIRIVNDNVDIIRSQTDEIITKSDTAIEKIDGLVKLLTGGEENQQKVLGKYFDTIRKIYEEKPDEDKQGLVGDLSLSESFIDITINPSKNKTNVSAVDFIEEWANSGNSENQSRVKVLYGEPGHGKTTIGYRLVYDYIVGRTEKKVFFFPLVSPTYSIVSPNDTISILDALRLDKFSVDSVLSRDLIDNSLIILDGYDELQVALGNKSRFSTLPQFYDLLNDFAKGYNCKILLTTRTASIDMYDAGMKHIKKSCLMMNTMSDDQQNAWIMKHHPSYMTIFSIQRNRFADIEEFSGNILGVPFVFILMVNAEFDDTAVNLVELYDKLFVATFKRKGINEELKLINEHRNYEILASKIYEQGDKRALISSLDEGVRVNIFAFSYYLTFNRGNETDSRNNCVTLEDIHTGYYEFYHRSFYEYFLAWYFYNEFLKLRYTNCQASFLYNLSNGTISEYVQRYLNQIVKNNGFGYEHYKEPVNKIIDYISKTDAIIIGEDGVRSIDRCASVFWNAITFSRIFVEHLLVHETTAERFSDYKDTALCKLIRAFSCQRINLSDAIMVGAHIDSSDLRKSTIINADISGKAYLSFSRLMYADFSGSNMECIDMYRADADNAIFKSVNLRSSRLEEASFVKAVFKDADLRGANFHRANLTKAVFNDVIVDETTNFSDTAFQGLVTNMDLSIAMPEFREHVENLKIKMTISWKVVYEHTDPKGAFTQRILWNPPKSTGYIVQSVSIVDELGFLTNYVKPYYEAWRVVDGVVVSDDCADDQPYQLCNHQYDDEFSNEGGGLLTEYAIDSVQEKLKAAELKGTSIKYRCNVYWVFDGSSAAKEIEKWSRNTVSMAGNLRASYDKPEKLGIGMERLYTVKFITEHEEG